MARLSTSILTVLLTLVLAAPAGANFKGKDGPIAYADGQGIHLLEPKGGASRLIGRHGHDPALFPGSRRFAYVREVGSAPAPGRHGVRYAERELFVKNVAGGAAAPGRGLFGPKAFFPADLSVTPDGRHVVFAARRSFGPGSVKGHDVEIWSASVSGDRVRRLTRNSVKDTDPEVSPDGRQVAFARRVSGRAQIFVMGIDGAHQRRLTFDPHRDRTPSWSPDGRRILYFQQAVGRDGTGRNRELYTVPVGGGRPHRLTRDKIEQSYPAYSPDGRHIAFVSELSVWEMPATGGAARRLTEFEPEEVGPPDWGTAP